MKYFVLFFLLSFGIYAQNEYGFLKNNPSNLRVGPGKRFPIIWVYQQKNLPVKIIDTYPDWYKIEDNWHDKYFPKVKIKVKVDVNLSTKGSLENTIKEKKNER